jgi:hypothetical protein
MHVQAFVAILAYTVAARPWGVLRGDQKPGCGRRLVPGEYQSILFNLRQLQVHGTGSRLLQPLIYLYGQEVCCCYGTWGLTTVVTRDCHWALLSVIPAEALDTCSSISSACCLDLTEESDKFRGSLIRLRNEV